MTDGGAGTQEAGRRQDFQIDGPDAADRRRRVAVSNLAKVFEDQQGQRFEALDGLELDVADGEFLCVVGPSGCGKSTLLRIIAGLEDPNEGDVTIVADGSGRPLISVVFQGDSLFPWLTVAENIAYGLRMRNVPREKRTAAVRKFTSMVGLSDFSGAYPHQLSGGMRQRVNVARAFANDPQILLMDEPFGALDEQTRLVLQQELLKIWEQTDKTVFFITHSLDEAALLADRVAVMSAQPGRTKAVVDIPFDHPRDVWSLKASDKFAEVVGRLWELLRDEVSIT